MVVYLCNAFSLSMVSTPAKIVVWEMSESDVKTLLSSQDFISAVGHGATASLLAKKLGLPITTSRQSITLTESDLLVVTQLMGQRLEAGKELSETELKNYPIKFLAVRLVK